MPFLFLGVIKVAEMKINTEKDLCQLKVKFPVKRQHHITVTASTERVPADR